MERIVRKKHKVNQRTSAPCKDPHLKAPMCPEQLREEAEEEELQLALHLSRVEAHRNHQAGSISRHATRSGREKEAARQPRSLTVGLTTRHEDGLKTLSPHPPPPDPRKSSRTRSKAAATLPPHLAKLTEAAMKHLPRSLVPCMLVPLKPRRAESVLPDLLEAPGETPMAAGASRTSNTRTTRIATTRTPEEPPGSQIMSVEQQDTGA